MVRFLRQTHIITLELQEFKFKKLRFYIAPYITPCGAISERGECLTRVRLTDRRFRTRTAFSLGFA